MSQTVGVTCYQVVGYRLEGGLVDIETSSLAPKNTNIATLLKQAAPSTSYLKTTSAHSASFRVKSSEEVAVRQLLDSLSLPMVVAALDDCKLAACLDFYSHPPDTRTAMGELVYQAKYRQNPDAAQELAKQAVRFSIGSPILKQADGIAAVPGSREDSSPGPLLDGIATALSDELGIPRVDLWRMQSTSKPQKDIATADGDDPDGNQRSTMLAGSPPRSVLVVDDLMGYGSSIREAVRALREKEATEVMALVLAKDVKGTQRYKFR